MSFEQAEARIAELANAKGGHVTPEVILDDAMREDSVLHQYFEWDDSVAGYKYRLEQARALIRRCKVIQSVQETYIAVPTYTRDSTVDKKTQGYVSVESVRSQEDLIRDTLLERFKYVEGALRNVRSIAALFGLESDIEDLVSSVVSVREKAEEAHYVELDRAA